MPSIAHKQFKGETIVEVMFAVAIFGAVAMVAIQMMNRGSVVAQAAVEAQQARNEMDAQASAIKFIHDGFLAEREHHNSANTDPPSRQFEELWNLITSSARTAAPPYHDNDTCTDVMSNDEPFYGNQAFIINTRALRPRGAPGYDASNIVRRPSDTSFIVAPIYPRLVFTGDDVTLTETAIFDDVSSVEGLQVFAIESNKRINGQPEYYDFHIRACWRPAGQLRDSKLSTITRALNPKAIE
ncbi:hypothetical protein FWG76_01900 [Candidatus Saccharibacteria bacterium]|nr:hypothetical protein [Candidatus Saccharibacteria bacterium]